MQILLELQETTNDRVNNPRKFYLIAHNPDTADDAVACLRNGANTLEPDVYFENGNFYVMEMVPLISKIFPPKKGPLLQDYLQNLQNKLIADSSLNLALILFDTKNLDKFDVNLLFEVIRKNFSDTFSGVAIGVTAGNRKYLNSFNNCVPASFEAVGIDGACEAKEADNFFNNLPLGYTFASGTSAPLIATTTASYQNRIKDALQLRNSGKGPKLVYAWTVNAAASMRTYLRLEVDGLITDKISAAVKVLNEKEFAGVFQLAIRGYNPF